MSYNPAAQLAQVTVKVKYDFADDVPKGTDTEVVKKERQERQDKYRKTYHDMIVTGWSKRYQFQNVREPKSVWGKLNPVTVAVDVQEVNANQHFLIQVKAATTRQSVGGGVANMNPNLAPQLAFNGPNGTGPSELTRVEKLVPAIEFGNNSAEIPPEAQGKLTLLAEYLRRMNNPKFKFVIVGHANATGPNAHNQELSGQRATAVSQFLKSNGVTNHTIESNGVGATGAGAGPEWRKVAITTSLPPGWQNTQDATLHEFGHMMGLGDEYVGPGRDVGAPATHYELVKKAFGKEYADTTAKVDGDRASLMEGGDDVRMYHYVTFWDATVLAAAKAPAPVPAFTHDDWKFIG
jgi:outer membrane protein OmpA-like peptidoglycan-associated protein